MKKLHDVALLQSTFTHCIFDWLGYRQLQVVQRTGCNKVGTHKVREAKAAANPSRTPPPPLSVVCPESFVTLTFRSDARIALAH
jgi:hypothetical protein